MQISETKINIDYKNYRYLFEFRHIRKSVSTLCFVLVISSSQADLVENVLSTLNVAFHDQHQLLSNFKDTFHLAHNFDIYYVSNSIKVRFKNKNTFGICKSSKQRKVRNTPPIISNCLK